MQGRIIKDHEGWWIQYYTVDERTAMAYITETALHPDDVKQIEEWSKTFDNIEARILSNPLVEYIIVKEKKKGEEYANTYAKLVDHFVDTNEMIDDTLTDAVKLAEELWEGCDGCNDVDKNFWMNGFVKGYIHASSNKSKYWYGRGILAAKTDRISELSPQKLENGSK